jgi:5'-nucleotidase
MLRILLTNDDGILAPGLRAMEEHFSSWGECWVVAPQVSVSACGRAVSLHRPLRVNEHGPRRLAVDGTPSDCVLLAFRSLLPSHPDVVVSGINSGINVGEDLDYSGTVAGAAEGALQGAGLSLAVSADEKLPAGELDWVATSARALAEALWPGSRPKNTFLNVNFPAGRTQRIRWTRQGNFLGTGTVEAGLDPRGRRYYWIGDRPREEHSPADTDRGALADGCISISILTLDRSVQGGPCASVPTLPGFQEG